MSPVKNDVSKCQFYPSCSHFGSEAIREFGFIKGTLLTADRFMRCSGGHLSKKSFPIVSNLLYDPPSKNFIFGEGYIWNIGLAGSSPHENPTKDTSIFSFPKFLFDNKDFNLSILELKRLSYNSNDDFIKEKSNLLISINHLKNHNLKDARDLISLVKFDNRLKCTNLKNEKIYISMN